MGQQYSGTDKTQTSPQGRKAPLSLCIASNAWTPKLEEIIETCSRHFDEVLIGYNGADEDIPVDYLYNKDKVVIRFMPWEGYSATKNKLANLARNSWILSLDADEMPDEHLLQSLSSLLYENLPVSNIYTFKRHSFFNGKKILHGAWGRDKVTRLYNRDYTGWNREAVHEALEGKGDTQLMPLEGVLLHYTADDYNSFLHKNRKYAELSADKYFEKKKKSPLWKRLFSPAFTFIKEYIFLGGFLDGREGYQIASINAMYTRWKYELLRDKYKA